MAKVTTSTPFAAIERSSAQQVGTGVSSAIDQVVVQVRQGTATAGSGDGIRQAPSELVEIIGLASRVVGDLSRKSQEEAAQSAKVVGVIAAVVLVVVACVIAAVTFGAGAALVALAVIAASSIIGGVIAVGQGASTFAQSVLGAQLAAALIPVRTVLQNFGATRGGDPIAARSQAQREILKAMRELQGMAPQTERLVGPCLGDPAASYDALQRMPEALSRLIAALRQGRAAGGSEAIETAAALEGLYAVLIKALQNLRPLVRPRK
jgi:hypothetical protein